MFSSIELALASSSLRRMQLLDCLEVNYQRCPVSADEARRDAERPEDYVLRVASDKAYLAKRQYKLQMPILAADTAVVIGGKILGKPSDRQQARQMLEKLSGNMHTVFTGVILLRLTDSKTILDKSQVWFDTLSPEVLEAYLDCGEFEGKAGAYAIQGKAQAFVKRIEGSFSGVMGLPLYAAVSLINWAEGRED